MSVSENELAPLLASGWQLSSDKTAISKRFQFKNFIEAFGWMTQAALVAEKLNHHPDWSNVYRTVDVTLTTHDKLDLSELDIQLATRMDQLAS